MRDIEVLPDLYVTPGDRCSAALLKINSVLSSDPGLCGVSGNAGVSEVMVLSVVPDTGDSGVAMAEGLSLVISSSPKVSLEELVAGVKTIWCG